MDGRTEVWAAGVTYERSGPRGWRRASSRRTSTTGCTRRARPELFFKSAAWRVSGPGAPVSVRSDSSIDVPEPELAVVLNAAGAVAGYTICNDMSSRSIEGENPLYLPQAKIYLGGCAVGPWIVPAWEVPDPYALTIELTIARDGSTAWAGSASTAALHRKIDELAAYLFRADEFPAGVILSTGTSVVPELPFTLEAGDEVRIRISASASWPIPWSAASPPASPPGRARRRLPPGPRRTGPRRTCSDLPGCRTPSSEVRTRLAGGT